jgi:LysR family glycine cleavage system transcriptional activator
MPTSPRRGGRRTLSQLPPLNALRAFVVAARHLSFSKAAEELFVTPAAISQQIRQLEEQLGCQLFRRGSKQLFLTDEGQACLPGLTEAFEQMVDAVTAIDSVEGSHILTVSAAPSFAAKWLLPRIEHFEEAHPEIDIRLSAAMGMVDFGREAVDCAIRYGGGIYPGLFVEKLLSESVVPVASPELVRSAALERPADLTGVTLLHDASLDRDASCPDWTMWLKAAGVRGIDTRRGPHFNQSSLVLEAAILGRGVALAKARIAESDLRAGRLVRLFGYSLPIGFAYYFVCPPERGGLTRVRLFREWLLGQVALEDDPATVSGV